MKIRITNLGKKRGAVRAVLEEDWYEVEEEGGDLVVSVTPRAERDVLERVESEVRRRRGGVFDRLWGIFFPVTVRFE